MGFKKTKYVSKKRLQFESTMSENAIYQFSGPEVLGFTHSDSILCFPIVLLQKTIENKGRLAIFEMIPMSRELRKLVFDNANEDEIRQAALNNEMTTLREAGLARVIDGTTSVEEILRSTVEELQWQYLIT